MGFWSALGKGLLAGVGVAAAPFTGGASLAAGAGLAARLAPALISAGAAVGGAVIASKGAKGAAKTQSTAANRAGQRSERATQDAMRYIEARRTGQTAPQMSPYQQVGGSLEAVSRLAPTMPGRPPGPIQGGPVQSAPLSIGMAPGAAGGQLVTIQAPTGETKQVPAEQAARYLSQGARRVG